MNSSLFHVTTPCFLLPNSTFQLNYDSCLHQGNVLVLRGFCVSLMKINMEWNSKWGVIFCNSTHSYRLYVVNQLLQLKTQWQLYDFPLVRSISSMPSIINKFLIFPFLHKCKNCQHFWQSCREIFLLACRSVPCSCPLGMELKYITKIYLFWKNDLFENKKLKLGKDIVNQIILRRLEHQICKLYLRKMIRLKYY